MPHAITSLLQLCSFPLIQAEVSNTWPGALQRLSRRMLYNDVHNYRAIKKLSRWVLCNYARVFCNIFIWCNVKNVFWLFLLYVEIVSTRSTYMHTHTHVCVCCRATCMHTRVPACACVCVCACISSDTHTRAHAHTRVLHNDIPRRVPYTGTL